MQIVGINQSRLSRPTKAWPYRQPVPAAHVRRQPTEMPMQQQIIALFEKKLSDALRAVDRSTLEESRNLMKDVGPLPKCPPIGDVMRQTQQVLSRGHGDREGVAKQLVSEIVIGYASIFSPELANEIMRVVEKLFPRDHYVQSARNTQGQYARSKAPSNKFSQRIFEHEMSVVQVGAVNAAIQTLSHVRTVCDDALLKKKLTVIASNTTSSEKPVSQINFHGPVSGHVVVAGESVYNTELNLSLAEIIAKIDASVATPSEKEGAKSRLKEFLAHPLVAAVVGGLAGGAVG